MSVLDVVLRKCKSDNLLWLSREIDCKTCLLTGQRHNVAIIEYLFHAELLSSQKYCTSISVLNEAYATLWHQLVEENLHYESFS